MEFMHNNQAMAGSRDTHDAVAVGLAGVWERLEAIADRLSPEVAAKLAGEGDAATDECVTSGCDNLPFMCAECAPQCDMPSCSKRSMWCNQHKALQACFNTNCESIARWCDACAPTLCECRSREAVALEALVRVEEDNGGWYIRFGQYRSMSWGHEAAVRVDADRLRSELSRALPAPALTEEEIDALAREIAEDYIVSTVRSDEDHEIVASIGRLIRERRRRARDELRQTAEDRGKAMDAAEARANRLAAALRDAEAALLHDDPRAAERRIAAALAAEDREDTDADA